MKDINIIQISKEDFIEDMKTVIAEQLSTINHSPKKEELLTCFETEMLLKVSHPTRIKLTNDGILKAYKLGSRKTMYKRSEVMSALERIKIL